MATQGEGSSKASNALLKLSPPWTSVVMVRAAADAASPAAGALLLASGKQKESSRRNKHVVPGVPPCPFLLSFTLPIMKLSVFPFSL